MKKRIALVGVLAALSLGAVSTAMWQHPAPEPGAGQPNTQATTDQLPAPPRPPRDRPIERVITPPAKK